MFRKATPATAPARRRASTMSATITRKNSRTWCRFWSGNWGGRQPGRCCRCNRETSSRPLPISAIWCAIPVLRRRPRSSWGFTGSSSGTVATTGCDSEVRGAMERRIVPLIMCGGAGTRLWPASREVHPKQFLPLFGPRSTFQDTLLRVSDAALFDRPVVITNTTYRFMVQEQLAEIGVQADILLEPMRRDSGPAIAAGAEFAQIRDGDAVVLALAADHVVRDTAAFIAACREGLVAADTGRIVMFGVQPDRPAVEYGYISPGEPVSGNVRLVAKFVEKPDPSTAAQYVAAGYLWNSGNFMFRAGVLLDEYRSVDADSMEAVGAAVDKAGRDFDFVKLEPEAFAKAKA